METTFANGLMYYRARYYDPELEVFISQDPLDDAQRYVGGNPLSFIDPLWYRDASGVPQPNASDWSNEGTIDETASTVLTFTPLGRLGKAIGCKTILGTKALKATQDASRDAEWSFGFFKSNAKWINQMSKRGWTSEQITEAIRSGKAFTPKKPPWQSNQRVYPSRDGTIYNS